MTVSNNPRRATTLPCGSQIIPYAASTKKHPFSNIPVTLAEFTSGINPQNILPLEGATDVHTVPNLPSLSGQLGMINFTTDIRLPRHVHISQQPNDTHRLVSERIIVLNGTAIVEICGNMYVITPKTVVHIAAGAPHTWTACPAGVDVRGAIDVSEDVPLETFSTGKFLMVYEYEEVTGFYPTSRTEMLSRPEDYEKAGEETWTDIMIPRMNADEVRMRCRFI